MFNLIDGLQAKANEPKKKAQKQVWAIPLTDWTSFFTATNVNGKTHVSREALGAPLRLAYNSDDSVKLSKKGIPIVRIAKDISDNVRFVRELVHDGITAYAVDTIENNPDAYEAEKQACAKAGKPIADRDSVNYLKAITPAPEAETETPAPEAERELVTA